MAPIGGRAIRFYLRLKGVVEIASIGGRMSESSVVIHDA